MRLAIIVFAATAVAVYLPCVFLIFKEAVPVSEPDILFLKSELPLRTSVGSPRSELLPPREPSVSKKEIVFTVSVRTPPPSPPRPTPTPKTAAKPPEPNAVNPRTRRRDATEEELEQAATAVMKVLEERVKIRFLGPAPYIIFDSADGDGLLGLAGYDSDANRIILSPFLRNYDVKFVINDPGAANYPPIETGGLEERQSRPTGLRNAIARGLGYYYLDLMTEGGLSWSWLRTSSHPGPKRENPMARTVRMGIAQYFVEAAGSTHYNLDKDFAERTWDMANCTKESDFVDCSYWFVRPMIDEFGERGIRYLVTCPVEAASEHLLPGFQTAIQYRLSALADLKRESCKCK